LYQHIFSIAFLLTFYIHQCLLFCMGVKLGLAP
jgi:hypothetical protein